MRRIGADLIRANLPHPRSIVNVASLFSLTPTSLPASLGFAVGTS